MSHFDSETVLTELPTVAIPLNAETKPKSFSALVSSAWNIGDNPNGGYLTSLVLRALTQVLPHPDPLTVTTHFLRPGLPDTTCDIRVEIIKIGRTLSTARASLSQAGKSRIEVLAGFGDLSQSSGVDASMSIPAPTLPPPSQCISRSGETQGIHLPILQRLNVELHPDHANRAPATSIKQAEVSGWIKFADDRPVDSLTLPLFTDAFPPSPFGLLGTVGWVPTLELTVHVRRRPAPGWVSGRFVSEDLEHGRMIESGALWDSNGALVAQSRQLGLVMNRTD